MLLFNGAADAIPFPMDISIHLMLLFNIKDKEERKRVKNFNTSNVIV